jgi:predicted DsbA family dithiol-disulfide isomerase
MPSKKNKTETKKTIAKKTVVKKPIEVESVPVKTPKYIKLPLIGIIVFALVLASVSFCAGYTFLKIKSTSSTTTTAATASSSFAAQKTDKPSLQVFVMSFCPYGNQMETTLKPVIKLLSKSADIQLHYIFNEVSNLSDYCKQQSGDPTQCAAYIKAGYFKTDSECQTTIAAAAKQCSDEKNYLKIGNNLYSSLHGRMEANEDVREICAYNMSDDKTNFWNFVDNVNQNCTAQNADTCWTDQAKKANLDSDKITECFNTQAADLINKEIALTDQYKVQGSPTLIINGVNFPPDSAYTQDGKATLKVGNKTFTQDQFRTPDAIKEAVCASFKKAPKECKTVLTDDTATNNTAAANTGAGCGK